MEQVVQIPDEFRCTPFFEGNIDKIVYCSEQTFEELLQSTYFLFDIEKQYEPWNGIDKSIPIVLLYIVQSKLLKNCYKVLIFYLILKNNTSHGVELIRVFQLY